MPRARLPRFDRRARLLALSALGCVLLYVMAVNALVRAFGGVDTPLLSPAHHAHKTTALGRLALHAVGELGLWPHDDPRAAVSAAAGRHGVSRALALAVARVESSFEPHTISRTGAMGLMQLMPGTAADLGVIDPFEPEQNADGAVRYLKILLGRYGGEVARAVAAYNLGPARVPRTGPLSLPAETRAYVGAVLRASYSPGSRAYTLQR